MEFWYQHLREAQHITCLSKHLILNLNSKKLAITPISPFLDQEDGGAKITSEKSQINILNLNVNKRPISAVADNIEVLLKI